MGRVDQEGLHRPAVAPATRHRTGRTGSSSSGSPAARPGGAASPEGAQLVAPDADLDTTPVPMLGHVTSSYQSAALGRTFSLALVKSGRDRIGERVLAPLVDGTMEAEIVDLVVFDPENRDGTGDPAAAGEPAA